MIVNMSESGLNRLSRLWEEHMRVPFPPHMRRREIEGEDMVLLDADIAGCVSSSLSGPLDERHHEGLLRCLAAVEKVLPLIEDEGNAIEYYERLREMTALAAEIGNTNTR
ncbi:hypothetical protein ADK47_16185 [Streptomyces rimosus subsp. rimosus]|uniref:Uncharacterized protein n=5 Tax=Streptomyces TaxID=1883 RepID=A0A8A1V0A3_STRR1|nr:hypothetical protein ADK78_17350 [Kitasatospora aureofaciens]KOT32414.1 hypothetical protein ADK84_27925 [Streptomyces sp. NRRL WC-3701]KOT38591.1 hypothetical protein ADK42_16630 [Streptomyces rimosus subsp. rimosus]MYT42121.1 hypothetical protein [Streptomyces sp. SID5471]QDA10201.1 hypothetical protein CTZ40_41160 [Streptomyces rimosus]QGY70789.1 hypothetical protein V519_037275 [Streptomyces rimosus R6-500]QST86736.1 hypothetical protein SRIM_041795 [Streptomyces rimosus subsp. rimosus